MINLSVTDLFNRVYKMHSRTRYYTENVYVIKTFN